MSGIPARTIQRWVWPDGAESGATCVNHAGSQAKN
jgi:hypothetical protein